MTEKTQNEKVMDVKQELPELEIAMNPRGQYFIALKGTQEPFDKDASIYTEEKRAMVALHNLKENW